MAGRAASAEHRVRREGLKRHEAFGRAVQCVSTVLEVWKCLRVHYGAPMLKIVLPVIGLQRFGHLRTVRMYQK